MMLEDIQKIASHVPEILPKKKRLSDEELEEIAEIQVEWLKMAFPFLPYRYSSEYLVLETRALKRTDGRGGTYLAFNSHNPDGMKEYLKKYLQRCNRASPARGPFCRRAPPPVCASLWRFSH